MICFAWSGYPQYAARCVRAFVENTQERVVVVATRPNVPVKGMEELSGCPVLWVDNSDTRKLRLIIGDMPRVLIVSGWGCPILNRYRDEVKCNGGVVIAMVDNNFHLSFREILKAIRFRLSLRSKYVGYLVAGKSGARLMEFYGVGKTQIKKGLYAADETLFTGDIALHQREKKILFVGQIIARKNIIAFASAFIKANKDREWKLEICGCGPLQDMLPQDESIRVHDFVQPEDLAHLYRSARIFALPSLEEHWGVVVHEAVLSGCMLLLSDRIGAADDFLGRCNGYKFNPDSMADMVEKIGKCMCMTDVELLEAYRESLVVSRNASRELFVNSLKELIP